MTMPSWLKPGLYGAILGAVVISVIGFSWGGWVTGPSSRNRAAALAQSSVVAAMLPVCLDMARSDPARADKMATIRAASIYKRRDALMAAGWATMPGTDAPNRDIAQACLSELDL